MVPESINENVKKLLAILDADYEPVYIELTDEPETVELDCFDNVARKIKKDGGGIAYGWNIWEHKNFIEAEFHAIWIYNDEGYDITPKENGARKILFVEDSKKIDEGKYVMNIRLKTSKNELVDDLFATLDAEHRISNKAELAHIQSEKAFTEMEFDNLEMITSVKEMILELLEAGGSRESKCLCNSGKIFKNCHGDNLIKKMETI